MATPMLEIRVRCFGEPETVRVAERATVTFPEGLPGFERHTRFALVEDERLAPFYWLQSLDDEELGFLVIEPAILVSEYDFELPDSDAALLGFDGTAEPRVLCILTVPGEVRAMTANLRAPLAVNPERRLAKQVILTDERFPLRHPVFGPRALLTESREHSQETR